jgi:hypothetical protein
MHLTSLSPCKTQGPSDEKVNWITAVVVKSLTQLPDNEMI